MYCNRLYARLELWWEVRREVAPCKVASVALKAVTYCQVQADFPFMLRAKRRWCHRSRKWVRPPRFVLLSFSRTVFSQASPASLMFSARTASSHPPQTQQGAHANHMCYCKWPSVAKSRCQVISEILKVCSFGVFIRHKKMKPMP